MRKSKLSLGFIVAAFLLSYITAEDTLYLQKKIKSGKHLSIKKIFKNFSNTERDIYLNIPLHKNYTYFTKNDIFYFCKEAYPAITNFIIKGEGINIYKNNSYSLGNIPQKRFIQKENKRSLFVVKKGNRKPKIQKYYILYNISPDTQVIPPNTPIEIVIKKNNIKAVKKAYIVNETSVGSSALIRSSGNNHKTKIFLDKEKIRFKG